MQVLDKNIPESPERKGFRDPKHVLKIILRMGDYYVNQLDILCSANNRSRREVVEILISEAAAALKNDPDDRINPL